MSASRSGQARREKFREERELMKDIYNSVMMFADVRDAVRRAAGRIFRSGCEVNHDTPTECLRDDLFYAGLSDNRHRQKVLTLATPELHRGKDLTGASLQKKNPAAGGVRPGKCAEARSSSLIVCVASEYYHAGRDISVTSLTVRGRPLPSSLSGPGLPPTFSAHSRPPSGGFFSPEA